MMADVDLVIANEEDIQSVLGLAVEGTDVTAGQLNVMAHGAWRKRSRGRWVRRWWRSPCVKANPPATTGGAQCCGTARPARSIRVSGYDAARRSHRRRRQLCCRIALWTRHRPACCRQPAVRGGRQCPQADDPRRLQSCVCRGSGSSRRGRRVRARAAIAAVASPGRTDRIAIVTPPADRRGRRTPEVVEHHDVRAIAVAIDGKRSLIVDPAARK